MNWLLLKNSLLAGGLTTLLAVTFGFVAALWMSGLESRWRNALVAVAIMALALPPFLATNCWLHYLGISGVWRGWLHLDIVSLGGTVWVLSLLIWPITFLAVGSAWRSLQPEQLESDVAVTGRWLICGLLFPVARTALLRAAVLTFVLALNNFTVPAILQVKIFPVEVWLRFNTAFDTAGALRVSWPLIAGPLLLLLIFTRRDFPWPRLGGAVQPALFRRQLGGRWFWFCGAATVAICLLSVALPVFQLASVSRTWTELYGAVKAGQMAVWNSLWLAAVSASLCVVLGLVTWRWPVGIALWLPFLVPGVLVGIGLIAAFNRPRFAFFYQGPGIVILAFVVRYLALGWNPVAHAQRIVDRDLLDAARISGATGWQVLRRVRWPQIAPQVAAGWYIVFLLCLWDVESIIMVTPPGGETLALRTFNLLHYGHNAQVNALCLTLLMLAIAPLVLWKVAQVARGALRGLIRRPSRSMLRMSCLAVAGLAFAAALAGCAPPPSENDVPIESTIFSRAQVIGSRGVAAGELNKPRSVAVDKQDNLYVVDMTGRVQKFSPAGEFILSWQMPQTDKGKPKGMCRDIDGNIVVLEPHYQRVNYFSPTGQLLGQWGHYGTNAGELSLPRAVAVNSRGEIYVSEYEGIERLQRFTARGERLINGFGHGGTGPGEFNRAEGLFVDKQDRVYVADSCNHRIQVFTIDGKFLRTYGKPGTGRGELSYPYDICVDNAGRQYVAEFGNSRIQVFDAQDHSIEIIGGPGAKPGQFSDPWSLALDSAGDLYVADSLNHRVQKLIRK